MAEMRVLPQFLRATVVSVADRDVNGGPFRMQVQKPNGELVDVVAERPHMCAVGDDVGLVGYRRADDEKGALIVPADCDDFKARLAKLFGEPVKVRSFGIPVNIDQRPSLMAWFMLGMADSGLVRPRPGITIYENAAVSTSPIVKAAADSIADLKFGAPVAIVDAAALLPGTFGKLGQKIALEQALPARLESLVDGETVKNLFEGPSFITDAKQNSRSQFGRGLIVPFSPLETSAAEFIRTTGLPVTGYAPRSTVSAKIRQTFNLNGAVALALADRVGLTSTSTADGRHARAAFAATYAAIATMRQLGNTEDVTNGILKLAQWGDAGSLMRGAEVFVGDAIRAGMKAVDTDMAPNNAKDATTQAQRDVYLAAELAADHRLSSLELAEFQAALNAVKPIGDQKTGVMAMLSRARVLAGKLPEPAILSTGVVQPSALSRLAGVAMLVETLSHGPKAMENKDLRQQFANTLKADVVDTVKAGGGGYNLAKAVIERELDRLKDGVNVIVVPAGTAAFAHTEILDNYAGLAWQGMIDLRDEKLYAKNGELDRADPVRKPVATLRAKI